MPSRSARQVWTDGVAGVGVKFHGQFDYSWFEHGIGELDLCAAATEPLGDVD